MRWLGIALFLLGGAGTAHATWAAFDRRRPVDLAYAAAAPVALVVALLGLVLAFVPGFLG